MNKRNLKMHIKQHDIEELFFRKPKLFTKLTEYTLSLTNDIYKCQLCDEKLIGRNSVLYHYSEHLGDFDVFLDKTMNRRFKSLMMILNKIPEDTAIEEMAAKPKYEEGKRTVPCVLCDGVYMTKRNIQSHVAKAHSTLQMECDHCGKVLTDSYSFKNHMQMHEGVRDWACEVCGNKYRYKASLNVHMITHTREKHFNCKYCGKEYRFRGLLANHLKVHLGNYSCPSCEREFVDRAALKKHLKACQKCGTNEEDVDKDYEQSSSEDDDGEWLEGETTNNVDIITETNDADVIELREDSDNCMQVDNVDSIASLSHNQLDDDINRRFVVLNFEESESDFCENDDEGKGNDDDVIITEEEEEGVCVLQQSVNVGRDQNVGVGNVQIDLCNDEPNVLINLCDDDAEELNTATGKQNTRSSNSSRREEAVTTRTCPTMCDDLVEELNSSSSRGQNINIANSKSTSQNDSRRGKTAAIINPTINLCDDLAEDLNNSRSKGDNTNISSSTSQTDSCREECNAATINICDESVDELSITRAQNANIAPRSRPKVRPCSKKSAMSAINLSDEHEDELNIHDEGQNTNKKSINKESRAQNISSSSQTKSNFKESKLSRKQNRSSSPQRKESMPVTNLSIDLCDDQIEVLKSPNNSRGQNTYTILSKSQTDSHRKKSAAAINLSDKQEEELMFHDQLYVRGQSLISSKRNRSTNKGSTSSRKQNRSSSLQIKTIDKELTPGTSSAVDLSIDQVDNVNSSDYRGQNPNLTPSASQTTPHKNKSAAAADLGEKYENELHLHDQLYAKGQGRSSKRLRIGEQKGSSVRQQLSSVATAKQNVKSSVLSVGESEEFTPLHIRGQSARSSVPSNSQNSKESIVLQIRVQSASSVDSSSKEYAPQQTRGKTSKLISEESTIHLCDDYEKEFNIHDKLHDEGQNINKKSSNKEFRAQNLSSSSQSKSNFNESKLSRKQNRSSSPQRKKSTLVTNPPVDLCDDQIEVLKSPSNSRGQNTNTILSKSQTDSHRKKSAAAINLSDKQEEELMFHDQLYVRGESLISSKRSRSSNKGSTSSSLQIKTIDKEPRPGTSSVVDLSIDQVDKELPDTGQNCISPELCSKESALSYIRGQTFTSQIQTNPRESAPLVETTINLCNEYEGNLNSSDVGRQNVSFPDSSPQVCSKESVPLQLRGQNTSAETSNSQIPEVNVTINLCDEPEEELNISPELYSKECALSQVRGQNISSTTQNKSVNKKSTIMQIRGQNAKLVSRSLQFRCEKSTQVPARGEHVSAVSSTPQSSSKELTQLSTTGQNVITVVSSRPLSNQGSAPSLHESIINPPIALCDESAEEFINSERLLIREQNTNIASSSNEEALIVPLKDKELSAMNPDFEKPILPKNTPINVCVSPTKQLRSFRRVREQINLCDEELSKTPRDDELSPITPSVEELTNLLQPTDESNKSKQNINKLINPIDEEPSPMAFKDADTSPMTHNEGSSSPINLCEDSVKLLRSFRRLPIKEKNRSTSTSQINLYDEESSMTMTHVEESSSSSSPMIPPINADKSNKSKQNTSTPINPSDKEPSPIASRDVESSGIATHNEGQLSLMNPPRQDPAKEIRSSKRLQIKKQNKSTAFSSSSQTDLRKDELSKSDESSTITPHNKEPPTSMNPPINLLQYKNKLKKPKENSSIPINPSDEGPSAMASRDVDSLSITSKHMEPLAAHSEEILNPINLLQYKNTLRKPKPTNPNDAIPTPVAFRDEEPSTLPFNPPTNLLLDADDSNKRSQNDSDKAKSKSPIARTINLCDHDIEELTPSDDDEIYKLEQITDIDYSLSEEHCFAAMNLSDQEWNQTELNARTVQNQRLSSTNLSTEDFQDFDNSSANETKEQTNSTNCPLSPTGLIIEESIIYDHPVVEEQNARNTPISHNQCLPTTDGFTIAINVPDAVEEQIVESTTVISNSQNQTVKEFNIFDVIPDEEPTVATNLQKQCLSSTNLLDEKLTLCSQGKNQDLFNEQLNLATEEQSDALNQSLSSIDLCKEELDISDEKLNTSTAPINTQNQLLSSIDLLNGELNLSAGEVSSNSHFNQHLPSTEESNSAAAEQSNVQNRSLSSIDLCKEELDIVDEELNTRAAANNAQNQHLTSTDLLDKELNLRVDEQNKNRAPSNRQNQSLPSIDLLCKEELDVADENRNTNTAPSNTQNQNLSSDDLLNVCPDEQNKKIVSSNAQDQGLSSIDLCKEEEEELDVADEEQTTRTTPSNAQNQPSSSADLINVCPEEQNKSRVSSNFQNQSLPSTYVCKEEVLSIPDKEQNTIATQNQRLPSTDLSNEELSLRTEEQNRITDSTDLQNQRLSSTDLFNQEYNIFDEIPTGEEDTSLVSFNLQYQRLPYTDLFNEEVAQLMRNTASSSLQNQRLSSADLFGANFKGFDNSSMQMESKETYSDIDERLEELKHQFIYSNSQCNEEQLVNRKVGKMYVNRSRNPIDSSATVQSKNSKLSGQSDHLYFRKHQQNKQCDINVITPIEKTIKPKAVDNAELKQNQDKSSLAENSKPKTVDSTVLNQNVSLLKEVENAASKQRKSPICVDPTDAQNSSSHDSDVITPKTKRYKKASLVDIVETTHDSGVITEIAETNKPKTENKSSKQEAIDNTVIRPNVHLLGVADDAVSKKRQLIGKTQTCINLTDAQKPSTSHDFDVMKSKTQQSNKSLLVSVGATNVQKLLCHDYGAITRKTKQSNTSIANIPERTNQHKSSTQITVTTQSKYASLLEAVEDPRPKQTKLIDKIQYVDLTDEEKPSLFHDFNVVNPNTQQSNKTSLVGIGGKNPHEKANLSVTETLKISNQQKSSSEHTDAITQHAKQCIISLLGTPARKPKPGLFINKMRNRLKQQLIHHTTEVTPVKEKYVNMSEELKQQQQKDITSDNLMATMRERFPDLINESQESADGSSNVNVCELKSVVGSDDNLKAELKAIIAGPSGAGVSRMGREIGMLRESKLKIAAELETAIAGPSGSIGKAGGSKVGDLKTIEIAGVGKTSKSNDCDLESTTAIGESSAILIFGDSKAATARSTNIDRNSRCTKVGDLESTIVKTVDIGASSGMSNVVALETEIAGPSGILRSRKKKNRRKCIGRRKKNRNAHKFKIAESSILKQLKLTITETAQTAESSDRTKVDEPKTAILGPSGILRRKKKKGTRMREVGMKRKIRKAYKLKIAETAITGSSTSVKNVGRSKDDLKSTAAIITENAGKLKTSTAGPFITVRNIEELKPAIAKPPNTVETTNMDEPKQMIAEITDTAEISNSAKIVESKTGTRYPSITVTCTGTTKFDALKPITPETSKTTERSKVDELKTTSAEIATILCHETGELKSVPAEFPKDITSLIIDELKSTISNAASSLQVDELNMLKSAIAETSNTSGNVRNVGLMLRAETTGMKGTANINELIAEMLNVKEHTPTSVQLAELKPVISAKSIKVKSAIEEIFNTSADRITQTTNSSTVADHSNKTAQNHETITVSDLKTAIEEISARKSATTATQSTRSSKVTQSKSSIADDFNKTAHNSAAITARDLQSALEEYVKTSAAKSKGTDFCRSQSPIRTVEKVESPLVTKLKSTLATTANTAANAKRLKVFKLRTVTAKNVWRPTRTYEKKSTRTDGSIKDGVELVGNIAGSSESAFVEIVNTSRSSGSIKSYDPNPMIVEIANIPGKSGNVKTYERKSTIAEITNIPRSSRRANVLDLKPTISNTPGKPGNIIVNDPRSATKEIDNTPGNFGSAKVCDPKSRTANIPGNSGSVNINDPKLVVQQIANNSGSSRSANICEPKSTISNIPGNSGSIKVDHPKSPHTSDENNKTSKVCESKTITETPSTAENSGRSKVCETKAGSTGYLKVVPLKSLIADTDNTAQNIKSLKVCQSKTAIPETIKATGNNQSLKIDESKSTLVSNVSSIGDFGSTNTCASNAGLYVQVKFGQQKLPIEDNSNTGQNSKYLKVNESKTIVKSTTADSVITNQQSNTHHSEPKTGPSTARIAKLTKDNTLKSILASGTGATQHSRSSSKVCEPKTGTSRDIVSTTQHSRSLKVSELKTATPDSVKTIGSKQSIKTDQIKSAASTAENSRSAKVCESKGGSSGYLKVVPLKSLIADTDNTAQNSKNNKVCESKTATSGTARKTIGNKQSSETTKVCELKAESSRHIKAGQLKSPLADVASTVQNTEAIIDTIEHSGSLKICERKTGPSSVGNATLLKESELKSTNSVSVSAAGSLKHCEPKTAPFVGTVTLSRDGESVNTTGSTQISESKAGSSTFRIAKLTKDNTLKSIMASTTGITEQRGGTKICELKADPPSVVTTTLSKDFDLEIINSTGSTQISKLKPGPSTVRVARLTKDNTLKSIMATRTGTTEHCESSKAGPSNAILKSNRSNSDNVKVSELKMNLLKKPSGNTVYKTISVPVKTFQTLKRRLDSEDEVVSETSDQSTKTKPIVLIKKVKSCPSTSAESSLLQIKNADAENKYRRLKPKDAITMATGESNLELQATTTLTAIAGNSEVIDLNAKTLTHKLKLQEQTRLIAPMPTQHTYPKYTRCSILNMPEQIYSIHTAPSKSDYSRKKVRKANVIMPYISDMPRIPPVNNLNTQLQLSTLRLLQEAQLVNLTQTKAQELPEETQLATLQNSPLKLPHEQTQSNVATTGNSSHNRNVNTNILSYQRRLNEEIQIAASQSSSLRLPQEQQHIIASVANTSHNSNVINPQSYPLRQQQETQIATSQNSSLRSIQPKPVIATTSQYNPQSYQVRLQETVTSQISSLRPIQPKPVIATTTSHNSPQSYQVRLQEEALTAISQRFPQKQSQPIIANTTPQNTTQSQLPSLEEQAASTLDRIQSFRLQLQEQLQSSTGSPQLQQDPLSIDISNIPSDKADNSSSPPKTENIDLISSDEEAIQIVEPKTYGLKLKDISLLTDPALLQPSTSTSVATPGRPKPPNYCDTCCRTFSELEDLITHIATHEHTFICMECRQTFSYPIKFAIHMHTHNDAHYQCPCSGCDFRTIFCVKIRSHIQEKHLANSTKYCKICKRYFAQIRMFQLHMLKHDQEKLRGNYACNVCGKCFEMATPKGMKVHKDAYICNSCDNAFSGKYFCK